MIRSLWVLKSQNGPTVFRLLSRQVSVGRLWDFTFGPTVVSIGKERTALKRDESSLIKRRIWVWTLPQH